MSLVERGIFFPWANLVPEHKLDIERHKISIGNSVENHVWDNTSTGDKRDVLLDKWFHSQQHVSLQCATTKQRQILADE